MTSVRESWLCISHLIYFFHSPPDDEAPDRSLGLDHDAFLDSLPFGCDLLDLHLRKIFMEHLAILLNANTSLILQIVISEILSMLVLFDEFAI